MSEYDDGDGYLHSSPQQRIKSVKNLRSLTIKQLTNINIESNPYKLNNVELSNIQTVGFISDSKEAKASGRVFSLTDFTSKIRCTFWASSSYDTQRCALLEDNSLIKAVCTIKAYNNDVTLQLACFDVIDDPNYLSYHFLQCIYEFLFYNNLLKREKKAAKKVSYVEQGFNQIQNDVLAVFRKNQDDGGLNVDVVVRMLVSQYGESELRDCIEKLINDCHLYAVDDNCYRTTFN